MVGASDRWPHMHARRRRWYVCLPMFHGTATFAILPACHATSGTIVLARRFSRRAFWGDVRRYGVDSVLYIGEMFRYLVQAPVDPAFPDERDHKVDLCYGLGLAPSVWAAMRERFGIPWIAEYYSASEATGALCNSNRNEFGVGKVARWGPIMRSRRFGQQTFYIVKTDFDSGELIRDPKTGFCKVADVGEVGEIISRVAPPVQKKHEYVGEGSGEANNRKYLRDVFKKGDEFTRLGDAVAIDADGFIKFHDRLGDTYRAKGHNISTTEVESWFSRHPRIASVNVYAIPMNHYGYDGQLGCAAITLHGNTSSDAADATEQEIVSQLENWLRTSDSALPAYAVPRFLRILVDTGAPSDQPGMGGDTGSDRVSLIMKKLKTGLRKDGFSVPPASRDRMYWLESEGIGFVPLTSANRELLLSGKARL